MTHEITIIVRANESDGESFTDRDLAEAIEATLHEIFPVDGGMPVVPEVIALIPGN